MTKNLKTKRFYIQNITVLIVVVVMKDGEILQNKDLISFDPTGKRISNNPSDFETVCLIAGNLMIGPLYRIFISKSRAPQNSV